MSLEEQLRSLEVAPKSVGCVWLGQAGYVFKSPGGVTVMLDPYLSDISEDAWGMARVIPPAIDHRAFRPDLLLSTHWHEDHLDRPIVRYYAKQPDVIMVGPTESAARARAWGWPAERTVDLNRGARYEHGDVAMTATFARHEPELDLAPAPGAIGFLLEIGGLRIWNVGDTEYDARLRPMKDAAIDVMIVPINGVGGNLNTHEAALLTWIVGPKVVMPNHYNMWAPETFGPGATLDPAEFAETLRRLGGTSDVRLPEVGEIVTL